MTGDTTTETTTGDTTTCDTTTGGARRALLAERIRARMAARNHPLSYPQQRLWFLDQLEPAGTVYLVPLVYRISGPLDVAALEAALSAVVHRHHVLRTVYRAVDGMPRQFVRPAEPVRIPIRDLSAAPDPSAEADRAAAEEAGRAFDLEHDLMIRPLLLRLAPEEHRLCLTLHHIACDGWSLGVLDAELSAFYGTGPEPPEPAEQYADYAGQQAARLTGEPLERALGYWREHLAGLPALSSLPADRPRPPRQSYAGRHLVFEIEPDVTGRIDALARSCDATPFAVMLAAFGALVHAHTGGDEVVVGTPVACRPREGLQHLIGFFANTVVQRLDVSGAPAFRDLVLRARDESRAALAHQDVPFEKLVEELHPSRDPAHNPVFQLMFSYHDGASDGLALPGCEVAMTPGDTGTSKFDLTMSVTRTGDRCSVRLEYGTDLFEDETAHALGAQFRTLLSAAMNDPRTGIGRLPVLPDDQAERVLREWNPDPEPAGGQPVHRLIEEQAARTPGAPALAAGPGGTETLTYRELDRRADALAARLRARGVGPDVPVGVFLDRTPQLVITLLAILKAGGAYLPLDPAYPWARLEFMVRDSGAPVVVTRGGLGRRLRDLPVTVLDAEEAEDTKEADGTAPAPGDLAYVIYTSGSTGDPKGVMITHRNVLNFFAGMDATMAGDRPGTWLAVTSMSFDISVLELLWTLARGYRVALRGDEPTAARTPGGARVPAAAQARTMDFSLFYFGGDRGGDHGAAYRLMMEGARFADRNGFTAVWTPERHFHEFGGLYPNPSVTAAAIAAVTERVAVRAGSVVLPLHDPLRVAEEWSVVDNLSGGGRVGLSAASGWQPDDFALAPGGYADRKQIMMRSLDELRRLWRGEQVRRRNGTGAETEVGIYPRPLTAELPVWITGARSPETFRLAGEAGAGLLTHLLGHTVDELAGKVELYRRAWRDAGHPGEGHVTVMLHTFIGPDEDAVRDLVREPLCAYIKSSFDLLSGLGQAMGSAADVRGLPEDELDALVRRAFDRFFETSGLLGTPGHGADMIDRLKAIGVDEAACLVDFGVPHEAVLGSLEHLASVRELSEARRRAARADEPVADQLRRHRVTHLQCTPSMAGLLAEDPESAAALGGLRRLLVGGEALPEPLAERLAELLPEGVHNMYGPTEATVWATTAPVDGSGPVTIGGPMANVRAYVVDRHLRPAPASAPGELLLGGEGLARGYLARPGLTAERFIPDPFSGEPGARLYRTGDLVRRRPDGALEFLGRLDHQVKVHGHRIELGEIENVLRAHPDVRGAAAAVHGEDRHRRIVAYVVPAAGADLTDRAVRASAAGTLPEYMVPADVVFLDGLPMTPNGKVDRRRLPEPQRRPRGEYRPPDNDIERRVAEELAAVLKRDRIGVEDNFFEAGGNSLLAVQARTRLLPVLGDRLSLVDIFSYPTVRGLVAALGRTGDAADGVARAREAAGRRAGARARRGGVMAGGEGVEPIAITGMACRVPGARTTAGFWRNMRDGTVSITRFDRAELLAAGVPGDVLADPDYVPASGHLEDADLFDADFFGFNPAEAETMDPQHRLLCETAWAAVEDSGHDPARFGGEAGVFAGAFMNKYLIGNLSTNARFQRSPMAPLARMFNDKDFLATRIAHLLDLKGPAYTVQTACSTSLVAVHLACQALLDYECDVALAGGVTVNVPLKAGYPVADSGLFSADGRCRPFDARAGGTIPGNGTVMVVLRRLPDALADGDHVHAVIRGSAVNNDGALKAGFAAPSVDGQARVIASALEVAGVDPATVGYVEAHGTATRVGDPIEVAALSRAFGPPPDGGPGCALGSVKANIGHLDAAAGIAGLLRAALAVREGVIPPNAGFTAPSPELRLADTPFYVPASARAWPSSDSPRRAGVSSFGVGGTNAHAVLEQAPEPQERTGAARRPWQLLPVSARTRTALDAMTGRLADFLDRSGDGTDLGDVAFTLQDGRRTFGVRRFAVCTDAGDAVRVLRGGEPGRTPTRPVPEDAREVVFAFPGGGTQHPGMGLDIYRSERVFRETVDECAELLRPRLGFDLRRLLFPSAFPPLEGRRLTGGRATMGRGQGAGVVSSLFVIEYALAKQLAAWGVRPIAMIGHSLGEYVAACLAGVFTLPGALDITLARGELFAAMPPGRMLVVGLPEDEVAPLLPERVSVSAVNAPELTVVAGPDEDIAALRSALRDEGVDCRNVGVPVASHSWMVEPYLDDFTTQVKKLRLAEPRTPFVSGVTGTWITAEEATDPVYWARHLRAPVRFAAGVGEALAAPGRVLLEVGPGRALTALAAAQRMAPAPVAVPTMGLPRDTLPDLARLVEAVGRLWQAGVPVDWRAFHGDAEPRRVPLPAYPFEGRRFWVAPGGAPAAPDPACVAERPAQEEATDAPGAPRTDRERRIARIWCDLLGLDRVGLDDDFFDLGAHSLMVTQITRDLRRMGATSLSAADVMAAPTVAAMADLVDRTIAGRPPAPAPAGPPLEEEVVLDEDIRADGLPAPSAEPPETVLLTGATGFVGAFLCAELLERTHATVVCLVRAADEEEGAARVEAALRSYGLGMPAPGRLRVVPGDLAEPLLGLDESGFEELAGSVDAIHHCGAWVNFVRPYRALKPANVLGTREVLRLATRGRLKPVHYISTLAVMAGAMNGAADTVREDDPLPPPVGHDTAYSQTKWVAEGLIGIARERGVPVSVYRAGGVLADSRNGAANTEDYVTKVVQGCVQLGLAPLREYALSVGTVDHLARLVVELSLRPEALGRTFHTIDPRPLPWNRIFDEIRVFGHPVRSVPFDRWRAALLEQVDRDGDDNALAPLMAMLGDTPDRRMPEIGCANVLGVLGAEAAAAPEAGSAFFGRMLSFLVRARQLPPADTPANVPSERELT